MEQGKIYSMLDIAIQVLKESDSPLHIQDIFDKVAEIKHFDVNSTKKINQLYQDMTQSALFVYQGEGRWDLKERDLESWDKDGTDFAKESNFDVDIDLDQVQDEILEYRNYTLDENQLSELDYDDYDDEDYEDDDDPKGIIFGSDDEDDELDEDEKQTIKEELEDKSFAKSTDDDDVEFGEDLLDYEDDYDEDDDINEYNDIMDDYEDQY